VQYDLLLINLSPNFSSCADILLTTSAQSRHRLRVSAVAPDYDDDFLESRSFRDSFHSSNSENHQERDALRFHFIINGPITSLNDQNLYLLGTFSCHRLIPDTGNGLRERAEEGNIPVALLMIHQLCDFATGV
jgi:hypothetical protein